MRRNYMVSISRCYITLCSSYKRTDEDISFIAEILYVLMIIFYDKNSDPDANGFKCNNCDKTVAYK